MKKGPLFWAALAALGLGAAGLLLHRDSPPPFPPRPRPQEPAPVPVPWAGLALLAGLGGAAFFLSKRAAPAQGRALKVLSSVPVAQNQRLVTVRFGSRVLLLGQGSSQITALAATADPEEIKLLEPEAAPEEPGAAGRGWPQAFLENLGWAGRYGRTALRALPLAACLVLAASAAHAQQLQLPLGLGFEAAKSPQQTVGALQTLLLMSALAFVPALILMATSFTRIVIVLSLLRQAMGLQQVPPNQVIVALSLFLTLFVMRPQLDAMNQSALRPYLAGAIGHAEAFKRAEGPLRSFMLAQTRRKDLQSFTTMSGVKDAQEVPLTVLVPAFLASELKTAFQIGFTLFIPFLLVDMIVASILMSMGMVMIPPAMVSMPFKLLLFVLIDGWNLVLSGLAAGFR